jgi:O-antigen/teichoic acid export membrane protein
MLVASIYLYGGLYKDIAPSIKSIDISLWKDLVPIGMKFFFLTICTHLIVQATGFLISNLLGPEYVTNYSINNRYFSIATMVFAMMVQPLWSGYGEAYHRGDFAWIKSTVSRLHKFLLLVVLVMLVMLVSQKLVFRIWLADRINVDWSMSILFCFYYFFFMVKSIYQPLINSTSKIKLQMIAHAIMSVLYLAAVVFFVKTLGLGVNGVVLALIIAYSLPLALLSRLQAHKILAKSGGIWAK